MPRTGYARLVSQRPFHHGNLRVVLLDEAAEMVRTHGVDGLSLRELARRAGVSHGAPRSHFVDRQALLDALGELGFDRLTHEVQRAIAEGSTTLDRFRRVAQAYVDFAIDNAALMDLMFSAKTSGRPGEVQDAAARLFTILDESMGPRRATTEPDDAREVFKLLFGATMQGIAALVASHRISRTQGDRLVEAAADTMLESRLGRSAISHG